MNFDILVNKEHKLDKLFVPSNLVITDNNENNFHNYEDASLKPMIKKEVLPYFLMMQEEGLKQGFHIIIDSGYRSYDYQEVIWEQKVREKGIDYANKYVMKPGCSEHQTGLAFDIAYLKKGIYTDDVTSNDLEYLWLINNAHLYGFILRYPKDKEEMTGIGFEPWHFRFVGKKLATYLYENNLSLEEYHIRKKEEIFLRERK